MFRIGILVFIIALLFLPLRWGTPLSTEKVDVSPTPPEPVSILFVGDMMFDRYIRHIAGVATGDFIFSCIAPTLLNETLVVGNLEGPITSHASVSVGSAVGTPENTRFTFPVETAALLKRHNITLVSLGNNHALDFGWEGLEETKRLLGEAGVAYFGAPLMEGEDSNVHEVDVGGIPFTFIAYNQFAPDGWRSEGERTERAITTVREAGRLPIVFPHWGDEYVDVNDHQREMAARFVEVGAEAVVGAHPHVVQAREFLVADPSKSAIKPVYYSLGNFVFDQYFSPDVQQGLMVRLTFSEEGFISSDDIPVSLHQDGRVCITAL